MLSLERARTCELECTRTFYRCWLPRASAPTTDERPMGGMGHRQLKKRGRTEDAVLLSLAVGISRPGAPALARDAAPFGRAGGAAALLRRRCAKR